MRSGHHHAGGGHCESGQGFPHDQGGRAVHAGWTIPSGRIMTNIQPEKALVNGAFKYLAGFFLFSFKFRVSVNTILKK